MDHVVLSINEGLTWCILYEQYELHNRLGDYLVNENLKVSIKALFECLEGVEGRSYVL